MGAEITKTGSVLEDPRAKPILEKAAAHIEKLGGIDQAYDKYASKEAGGITKDGIDSFLKDADVGMFTRMIASPKMQEAMDANNDKVVQREELKKSWDLIRALRIKG